MSRKIIAFLLAAIVLFAVCAFGASCADAAVSEDAQSAEIAVEQTAIESKDQPIALVIGMGLGVVFFGLICIVVLSMIMSAIVRAVEKKTAKDAPEAPQTAAPAAVDLSPEKRREIIAAVSAVIAEELGTDVSAIRVTSFKKV